MDEGKQDSGKFGRESDDFICARSGRIATDHVTAIGDVSGRRADQKASREMDVTIDAVCPSLASTRCTSGTIVQDCSIRLNGYR